MEEEKVAESAPKPTRGGAKKTATTMSMCGLFFALSLSLSLSLLESMEMISKTY